MIQPSSGTHLLVGVFLLAVAALMLCPVMAQANLIPDPSFEQGTARWSLQSSGSVGTFIDSSVARTGSRSLRIVSQRDREYTAVQRSIGGVQAGREYVYTVWVRGNNVQGIGGGGKPVGWVHWRNSAGNVIYIGQGGIHQRYVWADYGTYSWRPFRMHLQAPSGAAALDVGFRTWSHVTGGTSYWDDVSLVPRSFPDRGSLLATHQVSSASTSSNGSLKTNQYGYTGSNFFEPAKNYTRSVVEWNNVSGGTNGGSRILSFRYALEGWEKEWEIFVNGVSQGRVKPTQTGWTNSWATIDREVNLRSGNNTVRVLLPEYGSAPHMVLMFDKLDLYAKAGGSSTPPPTPTAATPTISPNGGPFSSSVQVSLTSDTSGAAIYYTTNGSTPTTGSTRYSVPFALTSSATVQAMATAINHNNSAVASTTFTRSSSSDPVQPPSSGGGRQPYGGTAWPVPGIIQAEDYDTGGQSVAYHDTTGRNQGGQYRPDENVDIWNNPVEGYYTGANASGEWREYTVNVRTGGTYSLDLRVATPFSGRVMRITRNGAALTGPIEIPNTGAWNAWDTVMTTVPLTAGTHVLRVIFDVGGLNFNWMEIEPIGSSGGGSTSPGDGSSGSGQQPYGGSAWAVPGVIEAANYDLGGQNVAYYDRTSGNSGGKYREDDVDIWYHPKEGHYTGANATGEWLEYTVDVATTGQYRLDLRVATPNNGRQMRVDLNGVNVSGTINIPNTGGWIAWQTVRANANLTSGRHVLRVTFVEGGLNFAGIDIH